MRSLFSILFLFIVITATAQEKRPPPSVADTAFPYGQYYHVAEFYGGKAYLQQYINRNLKYPYSLKESSIEGKVIVWFMVDEHGNISDVRTIRGIDPLADSSAVSLIKNMPKWKPAFYKNKPVRSFCELPIIFKLE